MKRKTGARKCETEPNEEVTTVQGESREPRREARAPGALSGPATQVGRQGYYADLSITRISPESNEKRPEIELGPARGKSPTRKRVGSQERRFRGPDAGVEAVRSEKSHLSTDRWLSS